ncbi:class I adenylate-forming enzyme family protein [Streptomyces sp. NPDC019531]|uniref:class I adenylate-forming enzyme family protein n=1 Tax=Streptomyces sp. NPDC019531 TaxID=3365062 RepID=UPI00384B88F3
MNQSLPLGDRLCRLAAEQGDRPAVITVDLEQRTETLNWHELESLSAALAERFSAVRPHDADRRNAVVAVPAAHTLTSIVELVAVLRAGLVAAPLDAQAPPADRNARLEVIARAAGQPVTPEELLRGKVANTGSPATAHGGYLLLTGGTTGEPKPILRPGVPTWHPRVGPPLLLRETGWRTGQTHLVVGPLHHAAPFTHLLDGLLSGNTMVLPTMFYPELMVDLVEHYRIEWMQLTPTHMRLCDRILSSRAEALSSLRGVLHTAAPCPPDTKRVWVDAIGPERVYEMYAATEGMGVTLCRGSEWLARPGTVGRGFMTRIRIYDDEGHRLPPGETGVVHMCSPLGRRAPRVMRLGTGPASGVRPAGHDGFSTAGDHGRLDAAGYLYLAGRQDDLVIIGGENVYTNDVTEVVLSHPDVADACVIPESDDLLGAVLTALVQPRTGTAPTSQDIADHCRRHLARHKVPQQVRLVERLPRSAAGKLLRPQLPGGAV